MALAVQRYSTKSREIVVDSSGFDEQVPGAPLYLQLCATIQMARRSAYFRTPLTYLLI
jgi:hypothetical protein